MKEPKIIKILKTFTPEEMKSFEKFISSPYFNKGRNFRQLVKYLKKLHPNYDIEKISDEKLYKKAYPSGKFDKTRSPKVMKVLLSQLTQLMMNFLSIEGYQKNELLTKAFLIKEIRVRQLSNAVNLSVDEILKEQHSEKIEPSYFYDKYLLQNEKVMLYVESKNKDTLKLLKLQNEAEESLILFFVSRILEYEKFRQHYYHKGADKSQFSQNFYNNFDYKSFVNSFAGSGSSESVHILLMYLCNCIDNDYSDIKSYETMKELLLKHKKNYSGYVYNEFLFRILNFDLFQTVGDKLYFTKDYIYFYEDQIRNAIQDIKNHNIKDLFGIRAIFNIVRAYSFTGEIDRMKHYFENYSKYFPADIREDSINYGMGRIEFDSGNYEKALTVLSKNKFSIPTMQKEIKYLKLLSYAELNYFEQFYAELDSFKHFLEHTSGVPERHILTDKKVLSYISRYGKIKESNDKLEYELLSRELIELGTKNIFLQWLIGKLTERK